jgi:hypothetical protein
LTVNPCAMLKLAQLTMAWVVVCVTLSVVLPDMAAVAEPNCRNDVAAEPQELPGPHFVGSAGGGAADTVNVTITAGPKNAASLRVESDGLGIFNPRVASASSFLPMVSQKPPIDITAFNGKFRMHATRYCCVTKGSVGPGVSQPHSADADSR